MSWDVTLKKDGELVVVERFSAGGCYPLGGSSVAELNVTYNYGPLFMETLNPKGLWWLGGKRASDTVSALELAVIKLGTDSSANYWEPTRGNAGASLAVLLDWARKNPDAIFQVI